MTERRKRDKKLQNNEAKKTAKVIRILIKMILRILFLMIIFAGGERPFEY